MSTESHTETTIKDARDYIDSQIRQGKAAKCPCCTQTVKIYKRQIHSTMSRMLIELHKLGPGYHHIGDFIIGNTGTNDFSKFRYWGLVEEEVKDADDSTRRTSGRWKITDVGKQFIEDKVAVPKYVHVFNKKPLKMSGEPVRIRDSLGSNFNYEELMKR